MVGLFKNKSGKDGTSARRKLRDFEEEEPLEAEEEFEEFEDEADEDTGLSGLKEMSELMGRLDEIEDKLTRLDSGLAMIRDDTTQVRERMNQTDQDIRKLLSVYEVVSAKFNPFIDFSDKPPEGLTPVDDQPRQTAGVGGERTIRIQHEVRSDMKSSKKRESEDDFDLPPFDLEGDLPEFQPFGSAGSGTPSTARGSPARPDADAPPWEPGTLAAVPQRLDKRQNAQDDMIMRENAQERMVRAAARSKHNKKPLLAYVSHDFLTLTLVMRWIEFLFERVTRDKLSLVLDYYVDVGWISEDVKSEVMSYARGEMQDVTKYMAPEEIREDTFRELASPPAAPYKKVEDWRLSADDHLKSLLFIQKIAGLEVDKDRLNSLEQNIAKFKESLEGFHGV
jgi:flagellar protein FlaD